MTLKKNRAPLLCCFQLCAWFHCHMGIQTGVRVRKRLSWVLTYVTLTLPLTLTFCMDITFDHGNNSWKFHDDTMMGTWWKRCDRRTDRQTDRRTDRQTDGLNQSYSCLVAAKNIKMSTLLAICEGNSPVTSEWTAQRATNMEKASFWWCDHTLACSKCDLCYTLNIGLTSHNITYIWTHALALGYTLARDEVSMVSIFNKTWDCTTLWEDIVPHLNFFPLKRLFVLMVQYCEYSMISVG